MSQMSFSCNFTCNYMIHGMYCVYSTNFTSWDYNDFNANFYMLDLPGLTELSSFETKDFIQHQKMYSNTAIIFVRLRHNIDIECQCYQLNMFFEYFKRNDQSLVGLNTQEVTLFTFVRKYFHTAEIIPMEQNMINKTRKLERKLQLLKM